MSNIYHRGTACRQDQSRRVRGAGREFPRFPRAPWRFRTPAIYCSASRAL